jgi:hypothetical protein
MNDADLDHASQYNDWFSPEGVTPFPEGFTIPSLFTY